MIGSSPQGEDTVGDTMDFIKYYDAADWAPTNHGLGLSDSSGE